MRVTQNNEFKPITIVLETEQEAKILQTLLGTIEGINQEFRTKASELFWELSGLGVEGYEVKDDEGFNSEKVVMK